MRIFAILALGALAPAAALAQQATDEPEIIVTAPVEGAGIESLQGATIMRRDDIVADLNGGLGDTLDSKPGISTTFFGAGASRPIIRGLGEDRVRVLQNGIGAIDASTASPDHAVTADGLDAQRIEVLRGGAALAYGGNAVGGVVNVIDDSIPQRAIDGIETDALVSYNTGDEGRQGSVNVGAGLGDVSVRLSASARDTDDYSIPGFANADDTGERDHAPNSYTSFRAYSGGAALTRDWGFAGLAVKRTEDEYGIPPEAPGEPGGHIEMEQTRIESRGDVRISIGPFDKLDYGVQHADYEHTEFEGSGEPGTRFTSEGWEGRFEAHHENGRLQGAIGVQLIDNDFAAEGEEAFISATNTQDTGVFAVERFDAGFWGLEGGVRYEQRAIDNQGGGERDFDSVSASGGVFVRPAQNWFVGATLAHTERAPTAIELFADGPHLATANYEIGDATLSQETATSIELSTRYTTGPLQFELNLFRVGFDDYIALVQRGDVWWSDEGAGTTGFAANETDPSIPADASVIPVFIFTPRDATFTGGELSLTAHLFDAVGFAISGDAALDLVRAEFDAGGDLPRIPPMSTTLGLTGESTHFTARGEVVHTAEQDRIAAYETPTDSYTFLNANLAWRPFGDDDRLVLRVDGRNLTDEEGRVHASFLKNELPLPGRSVRFTVTTSF